MPAAVTARSPGWPTISGSRTGSPTFLKARRHELGAAGTRDDRGADRVRRGAVSGQVAEKRNRAKEIIENFMIAANGAIARLLEDRRFPVVRRVVRSPSAGNGSWRSRWPTERNCRPRPDAKALNDFLLRRRSADPLRFADLSLSVIKLLGRGEYAASFPDQEVTGHFGLAVSEYTHSTAPNRRYPDLITQRLLQAALAGREVPYARDQLTELAATVPRKKTMPKRSNG